MIIEKVLIKYMNVVTSDVFVRYEKEFAQRIISGLSKGYRINLNEPKFVQNLVSEINKIHDLSKKDNGNSFKLSTRAIFIHGNKSIVEFDYYGKKEKRELGDLIFIISLVFNSKKYFEKFTINQVKKDKISSRDISWDIKNKGQLYLLSRFPTFRCVKGIIPKREYNLPNYSGSLGSYGLLYKPGDFTYISATELDSFIGYRKKLKKNELHNLTNGLEKYLSHPFFYSNSSDIDELFHNIFKYRPYVFRRFLPFNLFDTCHYTYNTFDFSHKYLTMRIGEPIFMTVGIDNTQTRNFLWELLSAVKIKTIRAKEKNLDEVLSFMNKFIRYGYAYDRREEGLREDIEFDFEGGGIGIIHTIIKLSE